MIKDAVAPVCTPPADTTINCDAIHPDELANLTDAQLDEMFGAASCSDNLDCFDVGITQSIEIDNMDCREATITRSFVGSDWNLDSDTVTQTITVVYNPDWKLTFPADTTIGCGDNFPVASSISDILTSVGFCDRLSVNIEGQRFTGGSDACVKMVRTCLLYTSPSPRD